MKIELFSCCLLFGHLLSVIWLNSLNYQLFGYIMNVYPEINISFFFLNIKKLKISYHLIIMFNLFSQSKSSLFSTQINLLLMVPYFLRPLILKWGREDYFFLFTWSLRNLTRWNSFKFLWKITYSCSIHLNLIET